MPEPNAPQQGAKPAQQAQTPAKPSFDANDRGSQRETTQQRRDKFFLAVAAASLTRQNGRSPIALARECVAYTDAFLAALDMPTGA